MRQYGEAMSNPNDYPEVKLKRGRKPGFRMDDEHRRKIQSSNILTYLLQAFEGKRELSDLQAKIGLGLLKKVLPDLQSTTLSGDPENPVNLAITRIERVVIDPKGSDE